MNAQKETQVEVRGNQLLAERLYDVTAKQLWDVWTDPKHVTHWWGPRGFTTTTISHDLRPEGVWRFVMHGPDGRDYQNKIIYMEVEKPKRLAYRHSGDEETEPVRFHVTLDFEALGDKTKLTMKMVFETEAELQRVEREYGAIQGLRDTTTRLAEYLEARNEQ